MKSAAHARTDGGRLLAITLALALPLAGWIGLEYWNEQTHRTAAPPAERLPLQARQSQIIATPATDDYPVRENVPAPSPAPPRQGLFKCLHESKTVYTDQPDSNCAGTAVSSLERPAISAGLSPDKPFQTQLAEVEARKPAPSADRQQATLITRHGERNAALCATNIRAQESVKASLRQPHDAWSGDQMNQRLRKLTDEAFSLGC